MKEESMRKHSGYRDVIAHGVLAAVRDILDRNECIDVKVAEIRNAIDAYDSFFQTGRTTSCS